MANDSPPPPDASDIEIAVCGAIMTMPGLPRKPSALNKGPDEDGRIVGLM